MPRKYSYKTRKKGITTKSFTCVECGTEFQAKPYKEWKFCSMVCYRKSRKGVFLTPSRPCLLCGKPVRGSHHEKYCSHKCLSKAQESSRGRHLKCASCGKDFRAYDSQIDAKYCSRKCFFAHNRGKNHPRWNGGVLRGKHNGATYDTWRTEVFERDDFTCQECGLRGTYLYAHHIRPWAKYPELRFEISNGVTLCKECHIKVDPVFARFYSKEVC
jgi:hypothetical protein